MIVVLRMVYGMVSPFLSFMPRPHKVNAEVQKNTSIYHEHTHTHTPIWSAILQVNVRDSPLFLLPQSLSLSRFVFCILFSSHFLFNELMVMEMCMSQMCVTSEFVLYIQHMWEGLENGVWNAHRNYTSKISCTFFSFTFFSLFAHLIERKWGWTLMVLRRRGKPNQWNVSRLCKLHTIESNKIEKKWLNPKSRKEKKTRTQIWYKNYILLRLPF